jgi:hypothetical protein
MGELDRESATKEELGILMAGGTIEKQEAGAGS